MIYRYKLNLTSITTLTLPKGYKILTVKRKLNTPFRKSIASLWALIDPNEEETVEVNIHLIETGKKFNSTNLQYISTIEYPKINYIAHFFEEIPS